MYGCYRVSLDHHFFDEFRHPNRVVSPVLAEQGVCAGGQVTPFPETRLSLIRPIFMLPPSIAQVRVCPMQNLLVPRFL